MNVRLPLTSKTLTFDTSHIQFDVFTPFYLLFTPKNLAKNPSKNTNLFHSYRNGSLNYTWEVPTDAIIASGQGTTSAIINFGTTSCNVSVSAGNSCGNSDITYLPITIKIPAQPDSIYGCPGVPANSTRTYSTDTVDGSNLLLECTIRCNNNKWAGNYKYYY